MGSLAKLTDVQDVTILIVGAGSSATPVDVTHGLKNELGSYVNPDEVHIELISGSGAGVDLCVRPRVTRPGVANGKITLNAESDIAAGGGVTWTYVFRVVSKYYHTIQSKDHTV